MQIRLLEEADLEKAIAVWHETRKETHTAFGFESERGVTLEDSHRIFREYILPKNALWGAEKTGSIVGFLAICESYLDRMYVRPGEQGRGIGTALLEKAKELSPRGLELHTHEVNTGARAFYERNGFRAVRFGVSPPPESEPDVEYHWRPA